MQYTIIQHKLGMILTGECGVGKTFISKVLINQFLDGQCRFVYIPNPKLNSTELLSEILFQLENTDPIGPTITKPELLRLIQKRFSYYKNNNLYVVIIIDDAQAIANDELFEEIRLLMNLHEQDTVSFTLILSGNTQLMNKISTNPSLNQRLAMRFELLPLEEEETMKYIEHRLEVTGIKNKIFTPQAYKTIQRLSGGKPRVINNICDFALLTGFMQKAPMIDENIIAHVGKELGQETNDTDIK